MLIEDFVNIRDDLESVGFTAQQAALLSLYFELVSHIEGSPGYISLNKQLKLIRELNKDDSAGYIDSLVSY